jgi:hypothetical protein
MNGIGRAMIALLEPRGLSGKLERSYGGRSSGEREFQALIL